MQGLKYFEMKIVESFTDLDKANAYVKEINGFYGLQVSHANQLNDKFVLIEKDLIASKSETKEANKATESALAEVANLSAKLDLQEKHGSNGGTIVTINKKPYKLSGNRFITQTGEKNAEEVSKDEKFLAHLLKVGSGALTPLD